MLDGRSALFLLEKEKYNQAELQSELQRPFIAKFLIRAIEVKPGSLSTTLPAVTKSFMRSPSP